jgi:hypothetical protein
MIYTESIRDLVLEWIAEGYHHDNERGAPLLRLNYPGFFTDHDLHTA